MTQFVRDLSVVSSTYRRTATMSFGSFRGITIEGHSMDHDHIILRYHTITTVMMSHADTFKLHLLTRFLGLNYLHRKTTFFPHSLNPKMFFPSHHLRHIISALIEALNVKTKLPSIHFPYRTLDDSPSSHSNVYREQDFFIQAKAFMT